MPTVILRSLLGRAACVVVLVAAGVLAASVLRADGVGGLLPFLGWGGLVGTAVWGLWWAPRLVISEDGLAVRNMWRSHRLPWEAVEGYESRWTLVVLTRGGSRVPVAAAQRPGGLSRSWSERQRLRRAEMFGRSEPGGPGAATRQALEHRGVREEYLEPGEGTFRAHLDSVSAADLLEAYAERREVHRRLVARQARRAERLERGRQGGGPEAAADRPLTGAGQGSTPQPASASRVNPGPCLAIAVSVVLVLLSVLVR